MATLLEMATQIVAASAKNKPLSTQELIQELKKVHAVLQGIELGAPVEALQPCEDAPMALTIKQAFKQNEVICMICNKGMKALTRHLSQVHQIKPSQYRKQFNIPKTQPLMSKKYAEIRKEIASKMDLGANLAKAREARQVNIQKGKGKKK